MIPIKSEKRGLPGFHWLYPMIICTILGLVAVNILINLFWFQPFALALKDRLINLELVEAKRGAEAIQRRFNSEIKKFQNLAQAIAQVGKESQASEIFIYRALNPILREISVVNLDGWEEQRYSKREVFDPRKGRDFSFLEEFERAKRGETYISLVNFTKEAEPYVVITTPIRKLEIQQPQAVLRGIMYLRDIWRDILERRIGETGRLYVIDDKGMLIAHLQPSRVLKKTNLLNLPPTKSLILGKVFEGAQYLNEKGIKVIGVGAPIPDFRWGVIVEQNVAEILAPVNEVKIFVWIFLAAGVIVTLLLFWAAGGIREAHQKLIERALALEAKTRELEEAKSVLEIKVRAKTRELRELAESLEEEVKRRTAELRERMEQLEQFHKVAVGRELRMIELKKEIKRLQQKLEKLKKHESK